MLRAGHCDLSPAEQYSFTFKEVDDADQMAKGLSQWDIDFCQTSSGRFKGTVHEVWIGPLQILVERANQAIIEQGRTWPGGVSYGLMTATDTEGEVDSEMVLGHLHRVNSRHDLMFHTPKGFTFYSVTIRSEALQTLVQPDDEDLECVSALFAEDRSAGLHFRDFIGGLMSALSHQPGILESESTRKFIFDETLHEILQCSPDEFSRIDTGFKYNLVKQTRRFISDHIDEPITIGDICAHMKVSRRALQYSFQEVFGVNPVLYLRLIRLNGARRDLLSDAVDKKITNVAMKWGFWHFARFSKYYSDLFGELPSETRTLRARRC